MRARRMLLTALLLGAAIWSAAGDTGAADEWCFPVQYFERARFEAHPEHSAPYDVLLGQLGREQFLARHPGGRPPGGTGDVCFAATGRCVRGVFHAYWERHGGLAQQGYPLSDEFEEINPADGKVYRVQYFERARFEHHPEYAGGEAEVLLGLLGVESAWRTYRNAAAGYAIDYPAAWAVHERADADGSFVTAFTPPVGGAGVLVTALPGAVAPPGDDLPNVRCRPVTVGGLSGTRCVDTIALGVTTTLTGPARTFVIATVGKRPDPAVYDRLLASFRPTP